jgi:hypothetical protein
MSTIGLIMLAAVLEGQAEPRFFPLDPGNVWFYAQLDNDQSGRLEVAVVSREGDLARVTERILPVDSDPFPATEKSLFERSPDRIEIDLPEEGAQPHYLFAMDSWTHRDSPGCDDGVKMRVVTRTGFIDTPAGAFTGAIAIEITEGFCADAGTQVEWWAPDVGLAQWTEGTIAGPRTWTLVEFRHGGGGQTYQRGDANGDGQKDIGDAVRILNWLHAGGPAPTCLKAADVDGEQGTNITDPIALLNFLFLGGPRPPEPFLECGTAPGDETRTCLEFEACTT